MTDTYKDSLNLPHTDFPMKANLVEREPIILKNWDQTQLYQTLLKKKNPKGSFILGDGPPYANGDIHLGHAVNKILKDIVLKSKSLSGWQVPFVPGWDCHGLPIEHNVEKLVGKAGHKIDAKSFRAKCREYVEKQITSQRNSFIRLGVIGDWNNPYLTMDYQYEAETIRSLAKIIKNGHLYKGYKPVHWCLDCSSALAEAEVEYQDKNSSSIDICFTVKEKEKLPFKFKQAIGDRPVAIAVWTTTPWTLPANEAVAVHPEHEYVLVEVGIQDQLKDPVEEPFKNSVKEPVKDHIQAKELVKDHVQAKEPVKDHIQAKEPVNDHIQAKEQIKDHIQAHSHSKDPSKVQKLRSTLLIVMSELLESVIHRLDLKDYQILDKVAGRELEGISLQHPFYDRIVPVILGEHVTLDAGTGAVHIAPAHGQDDYELGLRYKLPIDNPVGSNGCYISTTPLLAGEHVLKVNEKILALLKEKGNLLHEMMITHSYPHCWRHKTPLIFRATQQWFIGMQQKGLREQSLAEIRKVKWVPTWGQARIEGMIADRPDWCISRQRVWGVPLSLCVHKETGDLHPKTQEIMEKVADLVEKSGVDAWYDLKLEELKELFGNEVGQYEKINDILDVWFDSGISHAAVLERRPELQFPADLYLEGSDQHRGWFQTSLLSSVAMHGVAPYRQVLTHGFTVDPHGRKMSKSLGNVVAPEKVIQTLGADILRLWVAATDYSAEMTVSDEILKRSSDTYRRIRNTARFLLANLNGFNPKTDALPAKDLLALDAWIIHRTHQLQTEIIQAFEEYNFHIIYQKLHNFCSLDLGSFYLDIIKDRQYTGKKTGIPRRSAQTAMYHIIEALVRWMAPILSFTAEEIWSYLPGQHSESVFLSEWYQDFPVIQSEHARGYATKPAAESVIQSGKIIEQERKKDISIQSGTMTEQKREKEISNQSETITEQKREKERGVQLGTIIEEERKKETGIMAEKAIEEEREKEIEEIIEQATGKTTGKMTELDILQDDFWEQILQVRNAVNKALEEARAAGLIGSGLEAEVTLYAKPSLQRILTKLQDELRFVLITSQAIVLPETEKTPDLAETELPGLWVKVLASTNKKCVRCWHRRQDVDENIEFPGLCSRCIDNIAGEGEIRRYA